MIQDEVEQGLLPVFLEEADELLPQIGAALLAWRERPGDKQSERKLQRSLHTLKGSARTVGALRLGEQIHLMEERVGAEGAYSQQGGWDDMQRDFERIGEMIGHLRDSCATVKCDAEPAERRPVTRPTSLAGIGKRLHRVIRQVADELNKEASLELAGTEIGLDARMLKKIVAPLEHLLRNAIVHGVESPAERLRKGKPAVGRIRLALYREGEEIMLEVTDDGAGLDLEGLRRKAVAFGLLQSGETVNAEHLAQLIFAPGLSTATDVTVTSGFGIGLDTVRNEIAELGGWIEVSTEKDRGTRFIIRLPQFPGPELAEKARLKL